MKIDDFTVYRKVVPERNPVYREFPLLSIRISGNF